MNCFLLIIFLSELSNFKKQKIKVALCVVAKEENRYISEFIDYYKKLGINKIYLYDNNNINGEKFDDILKNYIKKKIVQIIDFRGILRPQKLAFSQCYYNNKYNYDWIAFYDVDEFLYLYKFQRIDKFLSLSKFKNCSSLLINWKNYGDNNNIFYEQKPLSQRFLKPIIFSEKQKKHKFRYYASKSIVRGGLNITWKHFPHFLKDHNICRPNGEKIENPFSPPDYSSAFIKHYTTKSTEEYIDKLLKGDVLVNFEINKSYYKNRINDYYFFFNNKTQDKIKLFEKKFNINLNFIPKEKN